MARGIDLTLRVIANSKNRAAAGLLESAFHSTSEAVRKLAGTILVSRRSGQGLETIIRSFSPSDSDLVKLVNDNRAQLSPGLKGAIVAEDATLARQAFRLAFTQNFYEVLPTLAAYCLGPGSQETSSRTLNNSFLKFLDKFTAALAKNDPSEHQLLYKFLLPEFSKILVQKIKEYRFNRNEFTLTVYLRLYPFFSEVGIDRDLYLQLRLTSSPVYVAAYRRLLKDSESYLFRFITQCMDRLNPPPIVPQIVAGRADIPFLTALFKSIKKPLTLEQKTNLANLPPLAWVGQISAFLSEFDAEAQCGLVLLLQNISLTENELRSYLAQIFEFGIGEGRATALSVLAALPGTNIDRLIWDAAADEDPAVQMEALTHLNARAIPNATSRIMQFVESPHEEVRNTIHKLLPNFRFNRFMQTFDQLDDESRRRMFNVVKQLDKQTPAELTKMLASGEPMTRAKALLCIDYCRDVVLLVEDALCEVLTRDEMSKLRCRAAEQLVAGQRDESRTALVQAMHRDESPEVRAAAKTSLANRPTYWQTNNPERQ
jgi:hypothetical protein